MQVASRPYPLIEYAHKIGKNTADFTVNDLAAFMKWWLKEKPRKDLLKVTPEQRVGYNKDLAAMNKHREEEKVRKHTTKKFEDAQTSRLAERGIESPINDGEEEIIIHPENEVVCELALSRVDVDAMLWALNEIFENYDLTGTIHDIALKEIQGILENA